MKPREPLEHVLSLAGLSLCVYAAFQADGTVASMLETVRRYYAAQAFFGARRGASLHNPMENLWTT